MKRKLMFLLIFVSLTCSAYNVYLSSKVEKDMYDVALDNVESLTRSEGSDHGRPMLENVSTGAKKCANCSGTDCGAAC